jgi:hypothetical protein
VTKDEAGQKITNMGGQMHLMLPETACLACRGALNRKAVAEELMDEEHRAVYRQYGYVLGDEIIQPQVIQLNGVIVNHALNEFINLFTAFKAHHSYLVYDALQPRLLTISVRNAPGCLHCNVAGIGDAQPVWDSPSQAPPAEERTPTAPLHSENVPIHPPVSERTAVSVPAGAEHTITVSSHNTPNHRVWRFKPGGIKKWRNPFRTTQTSGT